MKLQARAIASVGRAALAAAVGVVLASCAAPFGSVVTSASPTVGTTATPSAALGAIAGTLSYPSSSIPPLAVYALRVGPGQPPYYRVQTVQDQSSFVIEPVTRGTYHVISYAPGAGGKLAGAYTRFVICGSTPSCTDHSLASVTVQAGQRVDGIPVTDWYAPAGTFPDPPDGTPVATAIPALGAFKTAKDAASAGGVRDTGATLVNGSVDTCSADQACFALGPEVTGVAAAYFSGQWRSAGSQMIPCWFYVFRNAAGWHYLNRGCARDGTVIPAVGLDDTVQVFGGVGCANVRATPGLSGGILACLPSGTTVTIDGGPNFVDDIRPSDQAHIGHIWWHLKGHGWMAHDFLVPGLVQGGA
jgi:hypothetical protein